MRFLVVTTPVTEYFEYWHGEDAEEKASILAQEGYRAIVSEIKSRHFIQSFTFEVDIPEEAGSGN